ncbi:hypothetical protein UFOVP1382_80 [uncultured Caudovirales phage]|uniref:Uncharacterized protein n=1 Tax=uncultured Caudovirales phage TaxID=2100421 RepID=A0A6J5RXV9_9CAUD|nr:hypothetical protein UFOVP1382_80 [uncultured Caudovirales phage]
MRALIEALKDSVLTQDDVSNIKSVLDHKKLTFDSFGWDSNVGTGEAKKYGVSGAHGNLYDFVTYDPEGRQRADHYGGDGDRDSEGWDRDYAEPLRKWAQSKLDAAMGKSAYRANVGDKGDLYIDMGRGVSKR